MKVEVTGIVAGGMPYYTVRDCNGIYHAIGFEQIKRIINKAKERGEEVEVNDISTFLGEHNKLLEYLKNEKGRKNGKERKESLPLL